MGSTSLVACPLNDDRLNGPDHDYDHLIGSDDKEYQYTNEHCTSLRGKSTKESENKDIDNYYHPINYNYSNMAKQEDRNIRWPRKNKEELYILNEEENSYTGMNKQESRTARGAIEKLIYISAFLITEATVIYIDILVICSNFTSSLVFPEPAYQQYKDLRSVTKFISYESYSLKKEQVDSLIVYWYFVIMSFADYIERWADTRYFGHYVYIYGYYVTPLMRYTLDQIYEYHRKSATESFEAFIKRVVLLSDRNYKVSFSKDDQDKIKKVTLHNKLDITLLNKCISICMEYYASWYSLNETYKINRLRLTETFEDFIRRITLSSRLVFKDFFTKDEKHNISIYDNLNLSLIKKCSDIWEVNYRPIIHPDISKEYLQIQITCKDFKDLRNNNFHNLPEPNMNVCNNYYQNLSKLENLIEDLVKVSKKRFRNYNITEIMKYIKLDFLLAKTPASFSEIFTNTFIFSFFLNLLFFFCFIYTF